VRERGRVGLFGLPERPDLAPFPVAQLFRSLPTILVSRSAQAEPGLTAFRRAVELVGDGSFDTAGMVTHTLGIERIADALELARERSDGAIKVSVAFD
jgi:L-iditol 2-dehydrogenase